jgi:hypothetical protein
VTTYERHQEIMRRMAADQNVPLIMARARAILPHSVEKAPVDNGLAEVIVASLSGTKEVLEAARTQAPTQSSLTTPFSGRLVRADQPNLNRTVFTAEDLAYGLPSLAGGPVTWNHESGTGAYGWIETASVVDHPDYGTHITIAGRLWTARFPEFSLSLASSLENNQASMSMECMGSSVQCLSPGCGCVATDETGACDHILKKSADRRMVSPTFYGAGLILGGVRPGWPDASLSLS